MKNKILNICAILLITNISLAQETIGSLKQLEECVSRPNYQSEGCPDLEDITYVKDVGNRLDQFVGIWKGTYDGKTYTLKLNKRIKYGNGKGLYRDLLIGRMKVQDNNGKVIYNTLSESNDDNTYFFGKNFQRNTYMMSLIVNTACNDSGVVFLEVQKQSNKMRIFFDRDKTWYNPKKCPNYSTYQTTLPEMAIMLTKQ